MYFAYTVAFFTPPAAPDSHAVIDGSGASRLVGRSAPAFTVRVSSYASWDRLLDSGAYAMASAFVAGRFDIDGDLIAAIRWWTARHANTSSQALALWRLGSKWESWFQSEERARRNIRFHYDRSNDFYQLFLDRQLVYSCAYFADPSWTLEQAQHEKLDLICRKLDLRPGETFLDIGCGWGALLLHAADAYGVSAVGCTLSDRQLSFARDAVRARRLQDRVVVADRDYRHVPGRFDKIASVGMYEHVGRRRLPTYFRTLAERLEPDGLLLNHGIARAAHASDDGATRFLRQRVFPGGELPYLLDVIREAERAGFEVLDVENLRSHYALTCAAWVSRLQANKTRCLDEVDSPTYRIWLLYLAAAAASFERGDTDIYQVLIAKRRGRASRRLSRASAFPNTRVTGSSSGPRT